MFTNSDEVRELLLFASSSISFIDSIIESSEESWEIHTFEKNITQIFLNKERGSLEFYAEMGEPDKENEIYTLKTLLTLNLLLKKDIPLRIAMNEGDDELVCLSEFNEINPGLFVLFLEDFLIHTAAIIEFIANSDNLQIHSRLVESFGMKV